MPSPVDPGTARKVWRTLEPYHGMIYFVPEAAEEYGQLGIHGRHGYFAAPLPLRWVPSLRKSSSSTFFNFNPPGSSTRRSRLRGTSGQPTVIDGAIPGADRRAAARARRREDGDDVVEAAALVREAASAGEL